MRAKQLHKVHIFLFLSLVLSMGLFESCRKYEDGPTFSLRSREARVSNDWMAASIIRNSIDETNLYDTYDMDFGEEGRFLWTFQKAGEDQTVIGATWELFRVDQEIRLTLDDKDPISGETQIYVFEIRRLRNDELWVRFILFGDEWDVRLIEK